MKIALFLQTTFPELKPPSLNQRHLTNAKVALGHDSLFIISVITKQANHEVTRWNIVVHDVIPVVYIGAGCTTIGDVIVVSAALDFKPKQIVNWYQLQTVEGFPCKRRREILAKSKLLHLK